MLVNGILKGSSHDYKLVRFFIGETNPLTLTELLLRRKLVREFVNKGPNDQPF